MKRATLPFGPGLSIDETCFDNGLRLLTLVDRSAPVVSFQSWFRVGSRDEEVGKTGIAHLLEHLMFKETTHRGPGEFDRLLELGGAEVNAATWTDWTCYYENVPKATFPLAVELEADRLTNLLFEEKEFLAEREVVMNERRWSVDGDVDGKGTEALYLAAYEHHPYRTPTIGFMKDIRRLSAEDCQGFYQRNYAPNHLTLVVVGDVDPKDVQARIKKHYGGISASKRRRRKPAPEARDRKRRKQSLRLETDTCKVLLGYPGPRYASRDYQAMLVAKELLAGSRSAPLTWRLVNQEELATDISFDLTPFEYPGLIEVGIDGRDGVAPKALLRPYDEEVKRFLAEGPSEAQLQSAKNRLELSMLTSMETASGKADQIGFDVTVAGDPSATFKMLEALPRLSRKQVQAVAQRYLDKGQRTRIDVLPKGSK